MTELDLLGYLEDFVWYHTSYRGLCVEKLDGLYLITKFRVVVAYDENEQPIS